MNAADYESKLRRKLTTEEVLDIPGSDRSPTNARTYKDLFKLIKGDEKACDTSMSETVTTSPQQQGLEEQQPVSRCETSPDTLFSRRLAPGEIMRVCNYAK